MTPRLATISLMTMFLIGVSSSSVPAQGDKISTASLKGITAVSVVVEGLPEGAKVLGLTEETIQTDVELKLRLAGMQVVAPKEGIKLLGGPFVYVRVGIADNHNAACIDVFLAQNAVLERNNQSAPGVITWFAGTLVTGPTAQGIRDRIKDSVDEFLNAWLSVNPKK